MISMSLHQLSQFFETEAPQEPEQSFAGVSIDSRKNCQGKLFIAIRGDQFDGHKYLETAYQSGAVAALVEHKLDCDIPQIVVGNCKQAMAQLSRYWRQVCHATIIGLTGSNGKTTVKEMLFHILQQQATTHATQGNFNNDIGVPLTLFELSVDDAYAVIEMGANHQGEIADLAAIAQPDIVYVNNVAAAHLTGFGTVQGVIDAKGELYAYCTPEHKALFNVDEVASRQWRSQCAAESQLNCALDAKADVQGQWQGSDTGLQLTVQYLDQQAMTSLCVFGEHNARNALAAISIAIIAGVDFQTAVQNLTGFAGVKGRLQMMGGPAQSRLINDSYNANPDSLEAGIKVVCALNGRAWLALGDMGELGKNSLALHIEAAKIARQLGVEKMFSIGPQSCQASREFGESGYCFEQLNDMSSEILAQIDEGVNLLVKGSRSAGMEQLVETLLSHSQSEDASRVV